jgi:phospholipid/cholesterol/gamma-HCH transport system ATP-binding protein
MTETDLIVQVRDLVYRVGGRTILDGITFDVPRGMCLGVMGMSGTGKSTLLRNLMGLVRPTSGDIIIDGVSIVGLSEQALASVRRKMGMCFQSAALFDSLTVAENVAFGLRRRARLTEEQITRRVQDALARVGMAGTEAMFPAELSGGMRKRVGIARALILEPELMLYDEPSAGLDPIIAARLDELIASLHREQRMTSIIVTHHVEELFFLCDTVMMLHQGKIVAMDTPEALRNSKDPLVRQFVEGRAHGPITV